MAEKKQYNIVLATGKEPHHKYWAFQLYENHHVVAILHPNPGSNKGKISKINEKVRYNLKYGYTWLFLKLLGQIYNKFSKASRKQEGKKYETIFFQNYLSKYDEIPREIIHNIKSVNDKETIELVNNLDVDVICVLGGDLAKKDFIESAKIASLNFHSGISPFYNGNGTNYWAVSDFRPNFVGGTLMYITERIDGGPIISHYLPPIEEDDHAGSLFMKNIIGAVKLYNNALDSIYKGKKPIGIKQQRSSRYLRAMDWTICQDLRLTYFHKNKMMKNFVRDEHIINYYDGPEGNSHIFEKTLEVILAKSK